MPWLTDERKSEEAQKRVGLRRAGFSRLALAFFMASAAFAVIAFWKGGPPLSPSSLRSSNSNRTSAPLKKALAVPPADNTRRALTSPAIDETGADLRQLVTSLTQLDLRRGPLTPQQSAEWKMRLHYLVEQRSAAVPAIREFLEQNVDLDLVSSDPSDHPSLRHAFLDALFQIGEPEAINLMLEILRTTSAPAEIGQVALDLEKLEPGKFRDDILHASRETLTLASAGQLPGMDVGPLFYLLHTYGGSGEAAILEETAQRWNFYSAIALANLPGGEGIPALVKLARRPSEQPEAGAALQALAQAAALHPQARSALTELARDGAFSDIQWASAMGAFAGEQQFIQNINRENTLPPAGEGITTHHLESSNQNFYIASPASGMSQEQARERISIIDQLILVSHSEKLSAALKTTRETLLAARPVE